MVVNCPLPQFPHSHRAVVGKIVNFPSTTIGSQPSPEASLASITCYVVAWPRPSLLPGPRVWPTQKAVIY